MSRTKISWLVSLTVFFVSVSTLSAQLPARQTTPNLELVVQTGHRDPITSVSFSADGRFVATGSTDNTVILWNAATGEKLRAFAGHSGPVTSVSLSADGSRLATGATNSPGSLPGSLSKAILWNTATGEKLRSFSGHMLGVNTVSLSADGTRLATGSSDPTVILWNAATGEKLRTFAGHSSIVSRVSLSADGTRLITGSADSTAILWNAATGEKLHTFAGHNGRVLGASLSADGTHLVTGSEDSTAILWNVATGEKLRTFAGHSHVVDSVSLSADGTRLATGSSDNTAILWNATTGEKLRTFAGHSERITSVSMSADGSRLATGSWDKTAILWNVATGEKLRTFAGHSSIVSSVILSADGTRLATAASLGRTVILWNMATGQKLRTFAGHSDIVTSVSLSADGTRLATGSWDKTAILSNVATGEKLRTFAGHSDWVESVSLSADGTRLVTGSGDKTAILWNAPTGEKLRTFAGHSDRIRSVNLTADGKRLATGSQDNTAMLWNASTGEKLRSFTPGRYLSVERVSVSADGTRLATSTPTRFGPPAILWNASTGVELRSFAGHSDPVTSVSLSADGTRLATGSQDKTAILWNAATGEKLRTFAGHSGSVESVYLSPDSQRLVTGSGDGTTRFWDTATAKQLCSLISLDSGQDWLVVTPDGYFDGSPNAAKFISYRIAGTLDFVPLENYRKQFERPGLLALVMKGEDYRRSTAVLASRDANSTNLTGEGPRDETIVVQDLPPKVRITSPIAKSESKDGKLIVEVEAESRGQYPVSQFRLLVNGRPWTQKFGLVEIAQPKLGKATARWEIALDPGKHSLEVLAYTKAVFASSEGIEVRYVGGGGDTDIPLPKLYILAIGISKYPAPLNLDYAHADAEAITAAFQQHSRGLFQKIETKLLTDEKATRDAILDGLEWLRRNMTQKDFGVFFFGGHGIKDERDVVYFLPIDGDKERLVRTAIDGNVLAQELTSTVGQLTVILDACHSGAIGGNKTRGVTDGLLRDLTSPEKGVAMMCSASGLEQAQESNEHRHGMFTVALLEGLSGKGNGKTGTEELKIRINDGAVYFKQLDTYVTDRVKQLSKGRQHPVTSVPRVFRDFPVSKP